jgi:pimeloyl-ACP methyl ester carboxylesterase
MMFFTSHFALRAYFHKRPNLDLAATLEELADDFIPLSDVHVFSLSGGLSVIRQFACLNRERIQAMYALGAAATPSLVPAAQPPSPVRDEAPGSEELPASAEPSVPTEEIDDTESE